MITKTAAGMLGKAWHGAGAVAGTALGVGFPVYQYMSGEDSMGGAVGSALGMTAASWVKPWLLQCWKSSPLKLLRV